MGCCWGGGIPPEGAGIGADSPIWGWLPFRVLVPFLVGSFPTPPLLDLRPKDFLEPLEPLLFVLLLDPLADALFFDLAPILMITADELVFNIYDQSFNLLDDEPAPIWLRTKIIQVEGLRVCSSCQYAVRLFARTALRRKTGLLHIW